VQGHQDGVPGRAHCGTHSLSRPLVPFYVHHVRGRLRARFAELIDNPAAVAAAVARLRRINGVGAVGGNPLLGSLIVEYDRDVLSPPLLAWKLLDHGFAVQATEPETRPLSPQVSVLSNRLVATAIGSAIEAIVHRAVLALVAG